MKVLVSGYQSIYMPFIKVPVKSDGGFFYEKAKQMGIKNFTISKKFSISKKLQTPPIGKTTNHTPLEKTIIFLGLNFSCKRNSQPTITFDIDLEMLFIYLLIPRKSDFLE
jgi:hypothetical protein